MIAHPPTGHESGFWADPHPLAFEPFATEATRTLGVLAGVLASHPFVAGEDFTIADIAHFGWLWRRGFPNIAFDGAPHVARWYETIEARPGVQRGIARVEALVPQD